MTVRIGELFAGYGGLGAGVQTALGGGDIAWVSDIDPGACRILAHRFPAAPNLGDITTIDWTTVPPVDVLTGGFPCQDLSAAGRRKGMRPGTRSGLWADFKTAIDVLRPPLVVIENVRGLLNGCAETDAGVCPACAAGDDLEPDEGRVGDGRHRPVLRALGRVLGDLANLGYDASWQGLRASDVGAPHARFRVFVLAWAADADRRARPRQAGNAVTSDSAGPDGRGPAVPRRRGGAAADAERGGRDGRPGASGPRRWAEPADGGVAAADTDGPRLERRERSRPQEPGPAVDDAAAAADADDGARRRGTAVPVGGPRRGTTPVRAGRRCDRGSAAADPSGDGRHEGRPEPAGLVGGPDAALGRAGAAADADRDRREVLERVEPRLGPRSDPDRRGSVDWGTSPAADTDSADGRRLPRSGASAAGTGDQAAAWGPYAGAVARWERTLGRPAPSPVEPAARGDGQRLSPAFVEWMMGLPAGWVTDVPGLTRNEALKALGNGVVPQQAAAALLALLPDAGFAADEKASTA